MNPNSPVLPPENEDPRPAQPGGSMLPGVSQDKWQVLDEPQPTSASPTAPAEQPSMQPHSLIPPQPAPLTPPIDRQIANDPVPLDGNSDTPTRAATKSSVPWKLIVIVAVALMVVAAAGGGVALWMKYDSDQKARVAHELREKEEAARRAELPTYPLSVDLTSESTVKWQTGKVLDGWALSNDTPTSAIHTSSQNSGIFSVHIIPTTAATVGVTDRTRTEAYIASRAAEAKATVTTNIGSMKVSSNDDETLEFSVADLSSKSVTDKAMKTRLAVRATAGYIYVVSYTAVESDWGSDTWNSLTKDIKLNGKFVS